MKVKKFNSLIIFFLLIVLASIAPFSSAQDETPEKKRAREILRTIDDMWRGDSSYTKFTMNVKTANYERNMELEGWSKGKDKTLVVILLPLKERGTATLKSGNNIYSYLPKTDRTIRLTSGMMMGSWMGSHFTNDDLVKESSMEEDYEPSVTFEGVKDGRNIIEFELIPKPDAAVVWGKISVTVLAEDYIPLIEYFYDEDMNIARTMTFSGVRELAGRPRPTVMRVLPADKPDEYTELNYKEMELDIEISDDFFSIGNLKRRR
ncbi:MAG: outer membrane lipoprotein-sorting protein [Deltaproteobacteria bacterium]|nr:outer membrane lipoprotein-sorting protein [Deltaproteobacteria bacterium]